MIYKLILAIFILGLETAIFETVATCPFCAKVASIVKEQAKSSGWFVRIAQAERYSNSDTKSNIQA